LSKISVKPEVRSADSDTDKTRVIFISCMVQLLLDKALYHDFVKNTYQRAGMMIGHQWRFGGATHLANYMGVDRHDLFYVTLDIKHFDQSALAGIITLILLLPLIGLVDDGSEEYRMTRAFLIQRAHEMSCKLVKWNDFEYRYIIGEVFSGLFVTSWIDTIYMQISVTCVLILIFLSIKSKSVLRAREFQKSFIRRLQYGDNSFYAFQFRFYDDIIGSVKDYTLGTFQSLLSSNIGMECKNEETFLFLTDDQKEAIQRRDFEYVTPLDVLSPMLTVIEPIFNCHDVIVRHDVVYYGPEFLKRRFVRLSISGVTHIVPWRHEDDMFTKSCISSNSELLPGDNPSKMSSKYLGLVIDTMATNPIAYSAMKTMYLLSLGNVKTITKEKLEESLVDGYKDSYVMKVLTRTGVSLTQVLKSLNYREFLKEFLWDDKWRNSWAVTFGLNLYNPDGSIRVPVWGDIKIPADTFYHRYDSYYGEI